MVECAYRRRRFVTNVTGEVPRAPPRRVGKGRSGCAYALVKPKAGGRQRDFEFANYPAFLIVARD